MLSLTNQIVSWSIILKQMDTMLLNSLRIGLKLPHAVIFDIRHS